MVHAADVAGGNSTVSAIATGTVYGNDANRRITITAKDASGNAATLPSPPALMKWSVDLFSASASCSPTHETPSCAISCSPNLAPHVPSPSCTSSTRVNAAEPQKNPVHWVDATSSVAYSGSGTDFTVVVQPEVAGAYDIFIGLLQAGGLLGRYYGNVYFRNAPFLERVDASINFQWGGGVITGFGSDYVSIRWEGKLRADHTEEYTLYVFADDGARVWVDKHLVLDSWVSGGNNETWATVKLRKDHFHDIIIDYREETGAATLELRWSSPSTAKSIVPPTNLYYVTPAYGSPFTNITINPGEPDSKQSTITSSPAQYTAAVAGRNETFQFLVRDVFKNPLRDFSAGVQSLINFTLEDTGTLSSLAPELTFLEEGQVFLNFTVFSAGVYPASLIVNGGDAQGSPFNVTVSPAATYPPAAFFYGDGKTSAKAGSTAYFVLETVDVFGNNRTEGGDSVFVRMSGPAGVVGFAAWLEQKDYYSCWYTPRVAGAYNLSVFISGVEVAGSPSAVTVVPGDPSSTQTVLSGTGLTSAVAGVPTLFSVLAKDAFDNTVSSSSLVFTAVALLVSSSPTPVSYTANVVATSPGQYQGNYTAMVAGQYQLSVKFNSLHVAQSPYTLSVVANSVVAGSSTHTAATTMTVDEPVKVSLTAKDLYNNPYLASGPVFTATLTCSGISVSNTSYYSGGQGIYFVQITPVKAGVCSLALEYSSQHIAGSPHSVTVKPGIATATNTTVTGDGIESVQAGTLAHFNIQAVDARGNPLVVGGSDYLINITTPTKKVLKGSVVDNNNGLYNVTYTTSESGPHDVDIVLRSPNGLYGKYYSDHTMTVPTISKVDEQVNFDWGNGAPDVSMPADFFAVDWSGEFTVPASGTYTFYVSLASSSATRLYIDHKLLLNEWDPLKGQAELFVDVVLAVGTKYPIKLLFKDAVGPARCVLLWKSANIPKQPIPKDRFFNLQALADSPFSVAVLPGATVATTTALKTEDGSTTISSTSPTQAQAGVPLVFVLQARDANGNLQNLTGEESQFDVQLQHKTLKTNVTGVVTQSSPFPPEIAQGVYNVSVVAVTSGLHSLSIKYKNVHVAGSPLTVTVVPGLIAGASCTAHDLKNVTAGTAVAFSIQARDQNSNALSADVAKAPSPVFTANFKFKSSSSYFSPSSVPDVTAAVAYSNSGKYSVTASLKTAGLYDLEVKLGSTAISGSPFPFLVEAGEAHPTTTALKTAHSGGSANQVLTFDVTTADQHSNIRLSGGHDFYVYVDNHNGGVFRANVSDNGSGNYTVAYSVPVAGAYSVGVQLGRVQGLTGEYFNNRWLRGSAEFTRVDKFIDLDWGSDLVTPTAKDFVSVRWSGFIKPVHAGLFVFTVNVDDGARVFINDILIINEFFSQAGTYTGNYTFPEEDLLYKIRIDYRENTNDAKLQLQWQCDQCGVALATVPQSALFAGADHIAASPFTVSVV